MNILETLKSRLLQALTDLAPDPVPFAEMLRPAQDPRFGDYQANCAMPLARQQGLNPRELALRIADRLDIADICRPPEIAGPGFINLSIRDEWLEGEINRMANDERLGVSPAPAPRTIVLDFSSPNVAKPMHVGHLRSTVIGDSLARTLRFLGHQVVTDNHIGDWGTQFGMIIYGYKHFVDEAAYAAHPVEELSRLYRLVNQLSEYHEAREALPNARQELEALAQALTAAENAKPVDDSQRKQLKKRRSEVEAARERVRSLESRIAVVDADASLAELARSHPHIARDARQETARLHAGDSENLKLWGQFLPQCLEALQRVYDRLGVRFDLTRGESEYNPLLAEVVDDLQRRGIARESDGACCVFISGNEAPFIIRKADGAFTYATTDLATIRYRVETLDATTLLYVVDARQSEHFRLLFATTRLWEQREVDLRHISFGTVMGPDGRPYKTRSGDTVGLESLLDEAVQKAREIVAANDDARQERELSEEQRDRIAEMVGIGGIKYADLRHNRESDYVFDADKMLAMTGNTATYMQYAHARVHGIFRKGKIDVQDLQGGPPIVVRQPAERALALKLCRYAETLSSVVEDYRPNLLTQYLYELANDLTTFYDQCPVLKAETEELRGSRLQLCALAGRVIRHGLSLLGIEAPDQM